MHVSSCHSSSATKTMAMRRPYPWRRPAPPSGAGAGAGSLRLARPALLSAPRRRRLEARAWQPPLSRVRRRGLRGPCGEGLARLPLMVSDFVGAELWFMMHSNINNQPLQQRLRGENKVPSDGGSAVQSLACWNWSPFLESVVLPGGE